MQQTYYNTVPASVPGVDERAVNGFVAKVFGWMFIGLLVTCVTTLAIVFGINASDAFARFIMSMSRVVFIVFIAEVLIVGAVSHRVARMNPLVAIALYLVYSILNGFTVGLFALLYAGNAATLGLALGITALSFGIMAVYGLVTKADVTRAGNLLKMGLVGVIILSVVNLFLRNGALDFFICIVGLFVFLGLTAYDTKRIKTFFAVAATGQSDPNGTVAVYNADGTAVSSNQTALASNLAIVGALMLYLDFVNMFLFILRLFGGGRR